MRWVLHGAPSMASSTSNGPARAFFGGGSCGVLAGGFDGSNRASSIAHCLIASSSSGAKLRTDALCSADLAAWPARTLHAVQTRPE